MADDVKRDSESEDNEEGSQWQLSASTLLCSGCRSRRISSDGLESKEEEEVRLTDDATAGSDEGKVVAHDSAPFFFSLLSASVGFGGDGALGGRDHSWC